jgi:hypothetical protein
MPAYAQEPSKQMKEFLSSERSLQDGFIGNAVLMIGVVAAQTDPKIADCINDWYLGAKDTTSKNLNIITTMKKHSSYRPETVILAVVEKACGEFRRAN